MARPMTSEQQAATRAAEKLAQTAEHRAHMANCEQYTPTDKPAVEPPLPSADPTAGQS